MTIYHRLKRQLTEAKAEVDNLITGKLLPDYHTYAFNMGKSRGLSTALAILDNLLKKDDNEPPREDD